MSVGWFIFDISEIGWPVFVWGFFFFFFTDSFGVGCFIVEWCVVGCFVADCFGVGCYITDCINTWCTLVCQVCISVWMKQCVMILPSYHISCFWQTHTDTLHWHYHCIEVDLMSYKYHTIFGSQFQAPLWTSAQIFTSYLHLDSLGG